MSIDMIANNIWYDTEQYCLSWLHCANVCQQFSFLEQTYWCYCYLMFISLCLICVLWWLMRIRRFKFVLLVMVMTCTGVLYLNMERIQAEVKSYFQFLTPVVSLPSPTWNNVEKKFLDSSRNYVKSENDIENSMNSGCSLPKVKYKNIRQIEFSLLSFSLKKWKPQK